MKYFYPYLLLCNTAPSFHYPILVNDKQGIQAKINKRNKNGAKQRKRKK